MQGPCVAQRADCVIAAVHDGAGNVDEGRSRVDELICIGQKAVVDEVMALDPREGQGEVGIFAVSFHCGVGQERRHTAFVETPRRGALALQLRVFAGESTVVGADDIVALRRRYGGHKICPGVWKKRCRPAAVKPLHFGLCEHKDAAQDQFHDPFGMAFCVGDRQCASPGSTKDLPAVDVEVCAERLDVLDKAPGRVVYETRVGTRASAASLIDQDDAIGCRIKEASMFGVASPARSTMEEQDRLALWISRLFPVDLMEVGDPEKTRRKRLDVWIE